MFDVFRFTRKFGSLRWRIIGFRDIHYHAIYWQVNYVQFYDLHNWHIVMIMN